MLLGMMSNKEHKEFIQTFKNRVHSIIALNIPNQVNFIDREKLSAIAQSCGIPSKTESSIESALKNATNGNKKEFEKLLNLMSQTYNYSIKYDEFQTVPKGFDESYKTFCGT